MGNTKKLPKIKMTAKLIKDINGYLSKDSGNKTVACQILMLENYKNKIVVDWWKEKIPKLFFVIAYEAIRTLAIHGCPKRSTSGRVGGSGVYAKYMSQLLIGAIDREVALQINNTDVAALTFTLSASTTGLVVDEITNVVVEQGDIVEWRTSGGTANTEQAQITALVWWL